VIRGGYGSLGFAAQVKIIEASIEGRKLFALNARFTALGMQRDIEAAYTASELFLNQAKEDLYRTSLRQAAQHAIDAGAGVLDADRAATLALKSTHVTRLHILELLASLGLKPTVVSHALVDAAPVLSCHLPLLEVLRSKLEDHRLPPGAFGRITPFFSGSSWVPSPQSTSLKNPGELLWIGDLEIVREGFAAAISSSRKAWWWRPLKRYAALKGKRLDLVGMPICGSHDATLIGSENTADPVLGKLLAATGRFANSTECVLLQGFIEKPVIGESATPSSKESVLMAWQNQLYRAFAEELDNYFTGVPLLMDCIPGLEGGADDDTIKVVLPYTVAMALDWMALIANVQRKKASCNLCTAGALQMSLSNPSVVRLETVEAQLVEAWAYFEEAKLAYAEEAQSGPDSQACKQAKAEVEKYEVVLRSFGFSAMLGNLWYMRSRPPPSASFLALSLNLPLSAPTGIFSPQLAASLCSSLASAFYMPAQAFEASPSAAHLLRVTGLVCVEDSTEAAAMQQCQAAGPFHALLVQVLSKFPQLQLVTSAASWQWCRGPTYGLLPWSCNWMAIFKRLPGDLLHIGPQGMHAHLRKALYALIVAQRQDAATGRSGTDAIRHLDLCVRSAPRFNDGVDSSMSFSTKGVLKAGCLTGNASISLHDHIVAALSADGIIFDPQLRLDVVSALELYSHFFDMVSHGPFHRGVNPAAYDARIADLKLIAAALTQAITSTFGAFQASAFDLSKMHALLEAPHWCELFVSMRWIGMHLFETFHKIIKQIARSNNNKHGLLPLLNNYLVNTALHSLLPHLLGKPATPLPCFERLPRLVMGKFGDAPHPPDLFSAAALASAWAEGVARGYFPASAQAPSLGSLKWHIKLHLTRNNPPHRKICTGALTTSSVVRPSQMDAATLKPEQPFFAQGEQGDFSLFCTHGPLLACRAFFSVSPSNDTFYALAQVYLPFDATSPAALHSPYTTWIRRQLSVTQLILPLECIHKHINYHFYGNSMTMNDIITKPFSEHVN